MLQKSSIVLFNTSKVSIFNKGPIMFFFPKHRVHCIEKGEKQRCGGQHAEVVASSNHGALLDKGVSYII